MRLMPAILSAVVTTGLIVVFNTQLPVGTGKTPRLGYFLSPQTGFWQNAEAVDADFSENISLQGINAKAEVLLDDRLVPHVYAETDADAYFVQGYLHAKFRLWQMEFQTHVAGGRLSEIQGEAGLKIDKYFRRLGMVYGAENSMKELEKDPEIKAACDAYTAGVNAYINQLNPKDYPLEYKLLDYKPENWTNLKTCLFLKFMSFDLSGQGDDDLLATNTKNFFGYELYQQLFPLAADSLDPILPKGTTFASPTVKTVTPASFDSLYIGKADSFSRISPIIPDKNNGSNNWAVSGTKTASGRPILCNDPHLGLNLPSLWYEIQITTPTSSSYGVSFPGSPCVIIGFNDSASWGVTNAGRDVKDFYRIQFKDSTMKQYQLNGNWQTAVIREEV
ncbi:MAG: penicillin acylase family protein, partial [Chitinophagaceae bacterium]